LWIRFLQKCYKVFPAQHNTQYIPRCRSVLGGHFNTNLHPLVFIVTAVKTSNPTQN
jgi:hypothetical protein